MPGAAYYGSRRFKVVILLFLANVVCFVDRVNISVAIVQMASQLEWSKETQGLILSSFFWGYTAMQIPAGYLCRRYGADVVLRAGVTVWSAMTLITPLAAQHSIPALVLVRVLMGVGEGVSQPTIHALLSQWTPVVERSRSVAIASGGSAVGTTLAMLSSPFADWWWPSLFYFFGAVGLAWVAVAQVYLQDRPSVRGGTPADEVAHIAAGRATPATLVTTRIPTNDSKPGKSVDVSRASKTGADCSTFDDGVVFKMGLQDGTGAVKPLDFRKVLQTPCVVAIYVAHFVYNWSLYILLSWVPTYFASLGVNVDRIGLYAVVPYVAMYAVDVGWAIRLDRMISAGMSVRDARVLSQTICAGVPSVALLYMALVPMSSPVTATAVLTVTLGLMGTSHSAFWANVIDVAPDRSADLLGLSNTIATVPGIVGNLFVGWVLETYGTFTYVWLSAAMLNLLGLALFRQYASADPISMV